MSRTRLATPASVALAAIAILIATLGWSAMDKAPVRITADFTSTVGVYPGSDVRLMGVPIGKVTSVTPRGAVVRVAMEYDSSYVVGGDAEALIVSPSVVADRFVQLTPPYSGRGTRLVSGTHLGVDRTRVPVELDEIYATAHDLLDALGPNGANGGGAVNRFLRTTAANLQGSGQVLHDAIQAMSGAADVFNSGSTDFFSSVASLQSLTSTFAANDTDVRAFNDQMAEMLTYLSSERQSLGTLLQTMSDSFGTITQFVKSNRSALRDDVSGLLDVSIALVAEKGALERIAQTIPLGLDNLNRTWDDNAQAARTRGNELEVLKNARGTICDAVLATNPMSGSLICPGLSNVLGGLQ